VSGADDRLDDAGTEPAPCFTVREAATNLRLNDKALYASIHEDGFRPTR